MPAARARRSRGSVAQDALCLGDVCGDRVHQGRRQAVVGLDAQLSQPGSDGAHLIGLGARFDGRGHEGGKFGTGPALVVGAFGMDEIEAVERVATVLDAAIHMDAAVLAGVPLNGRRRVDDRQLLCVRGDTEVVPRHYRDLGEQGALGFPALGATAEMVVRALPLDRHFDGILRTSAQQRAAREIRRTSLHTLIHVRVNRYSHVRHPPVCAHRELLLRTSP